MIKISKKPLEVTSFFFVAAAPPVAAAAPALPFHHGWTQQQRHRGYYGCYNVKVDRKVASPVLFFFFVYALCVIYVQGFFSAVSSRSSRRSKQAAATSQTGLAFHSTTVRRRPASIRVFCIIPTIITPPVYGSGGCSGPGLTDGDGAGFAGFGTVLHCSYYYSSYCFFFAICYDGKK